jgi:DNA-binding NarL/FixJ family response regulator
VAEASNGRDAVDEVERRTIDVALLDIRMPGGGGLEAVAAMATRAPNVRTAILTTFGDEAYITHALADGATGFLLKDSAPEELIHACGPWPRARHTCPRPSRAASSRR